MRACRIVRAHGSARGRSVSSTTSPRALRTRPHMLLGVDPFAELRVVDYGDAECVPAGLEQSHAAVERAVLDILEAGAMPIVLGGDHSVAYPNLVAMAKHHGRGAVGVIQFDTHADTADIVWGVRLSHGTPMRLAVDEGWIRGDHFIQVGLRGYWPHAAEFDWMRSVGMRWHTMYEVEERGIGAVIDTVIAEASEHLPESCLSDRRRRRARPGLGARHGNSRAGRSPSPRAPDRGSQVVPRASGRRDGGRGGLAALRPGERHGARRPPLRDRGPVRYRAASQGWAGAAPAAGGLRAEPAPARLVSTRRGPQPRGRRRPPGRARLRPLGAYARRPPELPPSRGNRARDRAPAPRGGAGRYRMAFRAAARAASRARGSSSGLME